MMWRSYLRYIMRRKNAFHLHSPFVYTLYTKVIRGGDDDAMCELGIRNRVEVPVGQLLDHYLSDHAEDTVFVARDLHDNQNNEAAWDTICRHPDVTLTIDLFREGWVFYREGMEKQDFVLRR